ncbi:MAG: hypothetical protein WD114_01445 [Phycisphaerales bacterium]
MNPMTLQSDAPPLRLAGEIELKPCTACAGRGHIACPQTVAVRTLGFNAVPALQPSTGHPIPCPSCRGKKVVPSA